jgi:hypothetical protein
MIRESDIRMKIWNDYLEQLEKDKKEEFEKEKQELIDKWSKQASKNSATIKNTHWLWVALL